MSTRDLIAYLMNSQRRKSPLRRCTGRPHTGRFRRSPWDTFGRRKPRRRSAGNTHICRPHIVPCHCSCPGTSAGCSRLPWSPAGTRTSHSRIGRCHCTHQGRTRRNNRGLPSRGYRGSCRRRVGRRRGHCSLCPRLDGEQGEQGLLLPYKPSIEPVLATHLKKNTFLHWVTNYLNAF